MQRHFNQTCEWLKFGARQMNRGNYSASELRTLNLMVNISITLRFRMTLNNWKIHRRIIQAHYEQLSEFERSRIIGLKESGWANRRIAHHMGRSVAAIRRCWQE
ncbi:hypothetical protein TNCV_4988961 [Trichonephila clavipes]|nr:hypothetical protein TNCV_4988961 [Trichonephila clavipes]